MSKNEKYDSILAKWLADDLTANEKSQLQESDSLDDLEFVSNEISSWSLPAMDIEKGLQDLKQRQLDSSKSKIFSIAPWLRIGAAAAVLFVAYIGWDHFLNTQIEFQTLTAETLFIELPDGSTMMLDAQSTASYNKKEWNKERKILIKGQAYFEVEKGKTFIVETTNGSVTVLGTKFNVKTIKKDFKVDCFEGKVKVKSNAQEKIIIKNEGVKLEVGSLNKISIQASSANWMNGFTMYEQEYLMNIISDLERYYPIKIILPIRYKELRFTGKLINTDQNKALEVLFKTMEISYFIDEKGNVTFE